MLKNLVGLGQILVFPDGAVSYDIYPTQILNVLMRKNIWFLL